MYATVYTFLTCTPIILHRQDRNCLNVVKSTPAVLQGRAREVRRSIANCNKHVSTKLTPVQTRCPMPYKTYTSITICCTIACKFHTCCTFNILGQPPCFSDSKMPHSFKQQTTNLESFFGSGKLSGILLR